MKHSKDISQNLVNQFMHKLSVILPPISDSVPKFVAVMKQANHVLLNESDHNLPRLTDTLKPFARTLACFSVQRGKQTHHRHCFPTRQFYRPSISEPSAPIPIFFYRPTIFHFLLRQLEGMAQGSKSIPHINRHRRSYRTSNKTHRDSRPLG